MGKLVYGMVVDKPCVGGRVAFVYCMVGTGVFTSAMAWCTTSAQLCARPGFAAAPLTGVGLLGFLRRCPALSVCVCGVGGRRRALPGGGTVGACVSVRARPYPLVWPAATPRGGWRGCARQRAGSAWCVPPLLRPRPP